MEYPPPMNLTKVACPHYLLFNASVKKIQHKEMNNLLGVCFTECVLLPHSSEHLMGVEGLNAWLSSWTLSAAVLGSQEWNLEGSESLPPEGDTFSFSDAFRISAGVLAKVPQALRNMAYRKGLSNHKKKLIYRA